MKIILHQLPPLQLGEIISRPSKICKTPYVADVTCSNFEDPLMVHTPSLGCCGMVEKSSQILMSTIQNVRPRPDGKPRCSHRAELAYFDEREEKQIVAVNPALAEYVAESALYLNCINNLTLKDPYSYSRQTTYMNSRFDFSGTCKDGREFILEIKNVPQADYVDVQKKERKKYNDYADSCERDQKVAYFPDGFRKVKTDVVSPRALKHVQELEEIVKTTNIRTILCFVVQRADVNRFQPSVLDPIYRKALQKAWMNGVEITTIQVNWKRNGACEFVRNDLPIHLFDTCGPQIKDETTKTLVDI